MGYLLTPARIRLAVATTLVAVLCGCVGGPALIEGAVTDADLLPGYYWVEYQPPRLLLYEMPRQRGDSGQWHALPTTASAWYAGPALYLLAEDGSWQPASDSPDQTLDEWLEVWDPGPAVPEAGLDE